MGCWGWPEPAPRAARPLAAERGRGGSGGRPRAAGVSLYRTTGTWCCVGAEPPCFWESCQALGGGCTDLSDWAPPGTPASGDSRAPRRWRRRRCLRLCRDLKPQAALTRGHGGHPLPTPLSHPTAEEPPGPPQGGSAPAPTHRGPTSAPNPAAVRLHGQGAQGQAQQQPQDHAQDRWHRHGPRRHRRCAAGGDNCGDIARRHEEGDPGQPGTGGLPGRAKLPVQVAPSGQRLLGDGVGVPLVPSPSLSQAT